MVPILYCWIHSDGLPEHSTYQSFLMGRNSPQAFLLLSTHLRFSRRISALNIVFFCCLKTLNVKSHPRTLPEPKYPHMSYGNVWYKHCFFSVFLVILSYSNLGSAIPGHQAFILIKADVGQPFLQWIKGQTISGKNPVILTANHKCSQSG